MSAVRHLQEQGVELQLTRAGSVKLFGLDQMPYQSASDLVEYAKAKKGAIVEELQEQGLQDSQRALNQLLALLQGDGRIALHFYQIRPIPTFSLIEIETVEPEAFFEAYVLFLKAADAISREALQLVRKCGQGHLLLEPSEVVG